MKRGSMSSKIPTNINEQMNRDPFYLKCCIVDANCSGKIERHHNLIFAGKRINRLFCILPVCKYHHDLEKTREIKEKLNWVMLNRANDSELEEFSKAIDYKKEKARLNNIYNPK